MSDLERLGRHVGEQHAVEFWRRARAEGWAKWMEPKWEASYLHAAEMASWRHIRFGYISRADDFLPIWTAGL